MPTSTIHHMRSRRKGRLGPAESLSESRIKVGRPRSPSPAGRQASLKRGERSPFLNREERNSIDSRRREPIQDVAFAAAAVFRLLRRAAAIRTRARRVDSRWT